jgi:4-hydroxybenzoyl-CoA thioesterase
MGGKDMSFRTQIKVRFGDIDHAGIVYYPRFLHYFHMALEEFFEVGLKVEYADILHKRDVALPTVHLESDFLKRLTFGDRIEMEVRVLRIGRTSITWGYRGYRMAEQEELVVEGRNVTVCVRTGSFEKKEVPQWLRDALLPYCIETDSE